MKSCKCQQKFGRDLKIEIKFLIPSFKRMEKATTPGLLNSLGYNPREIIISTQTEEDYKGYKSKFGDMATVIFRDASNCPGNRNTLLDHIGDGQQVIMLDDDIRSFCRLHSAEGEKKLKKYSNREQLDNQFRGMFKFCRACRSPMWGWYPVANAYFMNDTIDKKNILCGTILGISTSSWIRFDDRMDVKEDYELSLRLIEKGFNSVRFNGYAVEASHYSKGGCETAWSENRRCAKELLRRYPKLIKSSHRDGEIMFKGERK